jgi:hypothetical protein
VPTHDVSSLVRLTKSPEAYETARGTRRELPYEALLAAGRQQWEPGDRIRVYRKRNGEAGLATDVVAPGDDAGTAADPRDYDPEYYVRLLRTTYAERLARAYRSEDFATLFADADQYPLFVRPLDSIHTVLTPSGTALTNWDTPLDDSADG